MVHTVSRFLPNSADSLKALSPTYSLNATCNIPPIDPVIADETYSWSDLIAESWKNTEYAKGYFEEKLNLLQEAAKKYTAQAEREDQPAARALGFHRAKALLIKAHELPLGRGYTGILEDQIDELRIQEANACQEAAAGAQSLEKKLKWVEKGLNELKNPLDPRNSLTCYFSENPSKCEAAASLWLTAAESFLQSSDEKFRFFIIDLPHGEAPFSGTEFAAAQSFRNAADCLRYLGHYEKAQDFYEQALMILKKIDTTSYSLKTQAHLQEEIVGTSIGLLHIETSKQSSHAQKLKSLAARAFPEVMIAETFYQQLMIDNPPYYTIKRALRLEDAAYLTSDLNQKLELYQEARDSVQKAWDQNPNDCLRLEDFTQSKTIAFSLKQSLLGRLRQATDAAEQELHNETSSFARKFLFLAKNLFFNS